MAVYPNNVVTNTDLPDQTDGSSIVDAADVNKPYAEIIAITENIGAKPAEAKFNTGAFTSTPATTTLADRVTNIEQGVLPAYTAFNFSGGVAYIDGGTSALTGY